MLELINVNKTYKSKSGDTAALKNVNLTFEDSGLVFIIGKSGSGKTTLLNIIGGLDSADSGEIIINDKKFSEFKDSDYDSYRNTFVGFIFQEYNLLPEYTAEKNVMIANELQGVKSDSDELAKLFESVDIGGLQKRKISELSGGQKQRVAIARALIKNPSIIMADEPTGALDSVMGVQIINLLKELSKEKLVIVVSHDIEFAETYADRIIKISDGEIVEDSTITDEELTENVYATEGGLTVRTGVKLSNSESNTLVTAVQNGTPVTLTDKITLRRKTKTAINKIKSGVVNTISLIKSKMKYKSLAELGVKSLGVKPLRLVFTVLLSAVAFAVFGLFDTIAAYNKTNMVANVLKTGDYSAVSVSSVYYDGESSTEIGISEDFKSKISSDTGYDFRGVYGINRESTSVVNADVSIAALPNESRQDGSRYYFKSVNGFVEFKQSEINKSTGVIDKNGYNYKLIAGVYPGKNNVSNIAISSYLADCLIHYGYTANGKLVQSYEELLNNTIKFTGNTQTYTIVGIIDCGEIPSKYSELKTQYVSNLNYILSQDLKTYLYAGMYLNIFVGEGFVDTYRKSGNIQTGYVSSGYDYNLYYDGMRTNTLKGNDVFYNSDDFNFSSVLYFDEARQNSANNKVNLANDEILIHCSLLKNFLDKEIGQIDSTAVDDTGASVYTSVISNIGTVTMTKEAYESKDYEDKPEIGVLKRTAMNYIVNAIYGDNLTYKVLEVTQKSTNTGIKKVKKYKVVGVYWGVDNNSQLQSKAGNIVMNSNALEDINVSSKQGYYARIIAPMLKSGSASKSLAKLITAKEGVGLNWFNNSILETIDEYEGTIKQFANLFLYVAIALAIFSVFMLFNYISTSITSKRRSIGVLRALGSNGVDIFKMFFTESAIIAVINSIFALIFSAVGCVFVNLYIREIMHISINFALFGIRQVIIITLACITTAILASLIPILNIAKEKPVNLIARSN